MIELSTSHCLSSLELTARLQRLVARDWGDALRLTGDAVPHSWAMDAWINLILDREGFSAILPRSRCSRSGRSRWGARRPSGCRAHGRARKVLTPLPERADRGERAPALCPLAAMPLSLLGTGAEADRMTEHGLLERSCKASATPSEPTVTRSGSVNLRQRLER